MAEIDNGRLESIVWSARDPHLPSALLKQVLINVAACCALIERRCYAISQSLC
jgi:hypothetical protein